MKTGTMDYPTLQYFEWGHLPEHLGEVSRPFCELAHLMANGLEPGPEVVAGLQEQIDELDILGGKRLGRLEARIARLERGGGK